MHSDLMHPLGRTGVPGTRRLQRDYQLMNCVGEGTYGEVWKAVRKVPGDRLAPEHDSAQELVHPYYAVKKVKSSEVSGAAGTQKPLVGASMATLREIKLLKELRHHPNIIALTDVVIDMENESLALVYEFVDVTLADLIQRYKHQRTKQPGKLRGMSSRSSRAGSMSVLPKSMMQNIMRQLLGGLHYLHANWVVHRDIKPKNILLAHGQTHQDVVGVLKIADFGMARIFKSPAKPMAKTESVVVTLLYRAPELLLGAPRYGPAVDLWAAGCVFAECILGHALFGSKPRLYGGDTNANPLSASASTGASKKEGAPEPFQAAQCDTIFRMLKAPTPATWPGVERTRHWNQIQRWSRTKPFQRDRLAKVIDSPASSSMSDLLSRMLVLDPSHRITAAAALAHRFVNRTEAFNKQRAKKTMTLTQSPLAFKRSRMTMAPV